VSVIKKRLAKMLGKRHLKNEIFMVRTVMSVSTNNLLREKKVTHVQEKSKSGGLEYVLVT
jgi:DNA-binding Xre family transcriptional regulator